jgi:hypothetical protein
MAHPAAPLAGAVHQQPADSDSNSKVTVDYYCQGHGQPDVAIKVGGTTFAAHSSLLRMFSTCAAGMPEPFTEWDLNLLTIFDGRPPAAHVVAAWLEALYWYQGARHAPRTLQEALPVLRFADAIGSPAGFMSTLVDRIMDSWYWTITALDGTEIRLPLVENGPLYVVLTYPTMSKGFRGNAAIYSLANSPKDLAHIEQLHGSKNPSLKELVKVQHDDLPFMLLHPVSQLEELLYWSHTLKLEKLQRVLHAFIHRQFSIPGSRGLFHGTSNQIMSSRVVRSVDFLTAAEAWAKYLTCS